MQPKHLRLGGGLSQSLIHPIVLIGLLIAIVLMLLLPRKYVLVPVLLMAFLVPQWQQFVIGGAHIFAFRIIIVAGWIRVLFARLSFAPTRLAGRFDTVDKTFLLWACGHAVVFVLQYQNMAAVMNQAAGLLDMLGGYFLWRHLIQDDEDVERCLKVLVVIAAIVSGFMLNEHFTQLNYFGLLGVRPSLHSEVRGGVVRAQGPFAHALLAGTFGSTLLPLFVWLWKAGKSKGFAAVGLICSAIMPLLTMTSTAVLTYTAGVVGILCWPFRGYLRFIRWGLAVALVGLHIVMQAPVWYLISKIDLTGNSSSWHRAFIIDSFIQHFFDWWLIGVNESVDWGWSTWDTANQYVEEGKIGGLLALVCFIALILLTLQKLGKARKIVEGSGKREWYVWLLGVALFTHIVAFFGISYFDQTRVLWYAFLAMIAAATGPILTEITTETRLLATGARSSLRPPLPQIKSRKVGKATASISSAGSLGTH